MVVIVVSKRMESINDGIKKIAIVTSAAANTGHTYDTLMDATDGRGAMFERILDAYHIGTTGTRVDASWSNSTGIVTLGTVAAGAATVNVFIDGY